MTRRLLRLAERLTGLGVTRVVMEANLGLLETGLLPVGGAWV
jgi:hypothetical protein